MRASEQARAVPLILPAHGASRSRCLLLFPAQRPTLRRANASCARPSGARVAIRTSAVCVRSAPCHRSESHRQGLVCRGRRGGRAQTFSWAGAKAGPDGRGVWLRVALHDDARPQLLRPLRAQERPVPRRAYSVGRSLKCVVHLRARLGHWRDAQAIASALATATLSTRKRAPFCCAFARVCSGPHWGYCGKYIGTLGSHPASARAGGVARRPLAASSGVRLS